MLGGRRFVCKVDCQWEAWTEWSACQFTCGGGILGTRIKVMRQSAPSFEVTRRIYSDAKSATDGTRQWRFLAMIQLFCSHVQVTVGCALGFDSFPCQPAEAACDNNDKESRECNVNPCPVDCVSCHGPCGMLGRRLNLSLEGSETVYT